MELALKPVDCPLANVPRGIESKIAHADRFDNCNNDHGLADIGADYLLANPPYANFPWVRRCS